MEQGYICAGSRRAFVLAGKAKFTVRSLKTGHHLTFKVSSRDGKPSWVTARIGNEYVLIGSVGADGTFRALARDLPTDSLQTRAFAWVWSHIDDPQLEFFHCGVCGRCGRPLTDPESIRTGLGPVCRAA